MCRFSTGAGTHSNLSNVRIQTMKKIVLLSAVAALVAAPAFAAEEMKAAPATATPAATAAAPAAGTADKKIEMKDGSWAEVATTGAVKVSKDGGKTWSPAPDGTWEAKDGSKITTHGGKQAH